MTATPAVEELPLIIPVDDHVMEPKDLWQRSGGTFPHSRKVAHSMFAAVGMDAEDRYKVLRGNAVDAYGLHRFGIHD